jgi:tRNA threonylcarbamoyladenosine biosynthesis protein TsaE
MNRYQTRSRQETVDLGRAFASSLRPGDVVGLLGILGSGKTQFVAGVCGGLGVAGHTGSPTFTLIHEYPASFGIVAHIDLYRIDRPAEIAELGIQEYFNDRCICLIEWAEKVRGLLPARHHEVEFEFGAAENDRTITIRQLSEERA